MLGGSLTRIAPNTTENRQQSGTPMAQPAYRAEVKLASQVLTSPRQEKLALSPGMTIAAEIRQRDRTVLEYLLSPVERVAKEAGRER